MKPISKRSLAPLTIAALVGVGMTQTTTYAQSSDAELRARTQKRVESLFATAGNRARSLNLTTAQRAKLRSMAQKNAPLLRSIWNDTSLTGEQKKAKIRALTNEASAVFTPEQKQRLATGRGEAVGKLFETAAWVSDELNLTIDQQEKIKRIAFNNLRRGYSLGGGEKGTFSTIRGLILDSNNQIEKVLQPQQKAKWAVIKSAARREFVKRGRALRQMNRV